MSKLFGVALRITVKRLGSEEVSENELRKMIDEALKSESDPDAETVLSGEIDAVKELKK